MNQKRNNLPRVLIVTPEVTYLPDRMGSFSDCLTAKAGGLADVSASLVCELFRQGADIHVSIPNYKAIFGDCLTSFLQKDQTALRRVMPQDRLHLAEDRSFVHRQSIYSGNGFLFKTYDSGGVFWAIQQAMSFYRLPPHDRSRQISRIMTESAATFNYKKAARHYIDLYQKLLRHPVVKRMAEKNEPKKNKALAKT